MNKTEYIFTYLPRRGKFKECVNVTNYLNYYKRLKCDLKTMSTCRQGVCFVFEGPIGISKKLQDTDDSDYSDDSVEETIKYYEPPIDQNIRQYEHNIAKKLTPNIGQTLKQYPPTITQPINHDDDGDESDEAYGA